MLLQDTELQQLTRFAFRLSPSDSDEVHLDRVPVDGVDFVREVGSMVLGSRERIFWCSVEIVLILKTILVPTAEQLNLVPSDMAATAMVEQNSRLRSIPVQDCDNETP